MAVDPLPETGRSVGAASRIVTRAFTKSVVWPGLRDVGQTHLRFVKTRWLECSRPTLPTKVARPLLTGGDGELNANRERVNLAWIRDIRTRLDV